MKRLLIIPLAGVVALFVVAYLVGMLLPKSHRASRMARFGRSPQTLFALITGPQDWRGVQKTDLPDSDGIRMWRENDGRHSITFAQVQCDPPRLYRTQIADKNLPFSGSWTWEITPTSDGCTCRITEEGEISNPIFRLISRIRGQSTTIEHYLNALGRKLNEPLVIDN